MDKKKIERINELARKKKASGLTEAETAEQAELRREYLAEYRENMKAMLDNLIIQEHYMFYNGEEYALLVETSEEASEDGQQECIICKIVAEQDEDGEESESFELVEDESLGQKLVEIFNTKMAEDGEEEE